MSIEKGSFNLSGIETERKPSAGVALIIVGIDSIRDGGRDLSPKIWTIKEEKSKDSTNRIAGQISVPVETKKPNESIFSNIGGALAEFSNRDEYIENLFLGSITSNALNINGNSLNMAVLIFEGNLNAEIAPVDQDEVSPNGWMSIDELTNFDPTCIREPLLDFLDIERSENLLGKIVVRHIENLSNRIPVSDILPSDFNSIQDFFRKREELPDIAT